MGGNVGKPGDIKNNLKLEEFYKEIKVQQKPIGSYIYHHITKATKADKKKFYSEVRRLMYSKNKEDRQAAFNLIKGLKNDSDMKAFIKQIRAEEAAARAKKKH